MSISRFVPHTDYLRTASRSSLQSFELARLNHAANLRRDIAVLVDQWVQETCEAMLARWVLENHSAVRLPAADLLHAVQRSATDPFPDVSEPTSQIHAAPPLLAEREQRLSGTLGGKRRK